MKRNTRLNCFHKKKFISTISKVRLQVEKYGWIWDRPTIDRNYHSLRALTSFRLEIRKWPGGRSFRRGTPSVENQVLPLQVFAFVFLFFLSFWQLTYLRETGTQNGEMEDSEVCERPFVHLAALSWSLRVFLPRFERRITLVDVFARLDDHVEEHHAKFAD